jgi:maltose O-acetyltransferase
MTTLKIFAAGFANFLWNDIITHMPFRFARKLFLRLFNRKISGSSVILMHARILNFWNIEIGERVVINQYVLLDCRRHKVIIHHDADLGPYSRVWTLGHNPDSETHETTGGSVIIGHHVWIASGVTILPSVQLGEGAVVAAGSVVTKSIPPMEIWGGSPACLIRRRENTLTYTLKYNPYFE